MTAVSSMPRIESVWPTGAEFLRHVRRTETLVTFVHPSAPPAPLAPGTIVEVKIRFADRGLDFNVHGRVVDRLDDDPIAGLRLAFLSEERTRQELVLMTAEGENVPYLRRHSQRIPCRLPTDVTIDGGTTFATYTTNISARGAYLLVDQAPAGTQLELSIVFPQRRKPVRLFARVAAAVAGPRRGVGVEFLFESRQQRDAVAVEVARLEAEQA